jgi:iron complex outermembrane receptor protein
LEVAPELTVQDWLSAGLAFSLNKYSIGHSQAGIEVLSYYPHITLNGYAAIRPVQFLAIIPRLEYIDSRYANTEGTVTLDAYFLANIKITLEAGNHISASAGIDNIFDTYHEIRRYSPQPGRSFNLSLTVKYK